MEEIMRLRTLAATMFGDIRSFLHRARDAAQAARQNRVKLALGNDGERIFAQARIMQDVLAMSLEGAPLTVLRLSR